MNNSHDNQKHYVVKVNGMYVIAYRLDRDTTGVNHINAMELCSDEEKAFRFEDIEVAELVAKSINGLVLSHSVEYVKTVRSTLIRDYAMEDN